MNIKKWGLISIHALIAIGFSLAMAQHILDSSWELHARNHAFQATIWLVTVHLCGIAILWNAYPKKWAWYTLLAIAFLFFGGYFAALIIIPQSGAPGTKDDIAIFSLACVYFAILASDRVQRR
ncbi:hypothetical protein [Candidatus Uabimicrobium sp. HlEnr_7]|uniref:hypothetical protein n=1 Tax=Candidatus Uabimicrobium helgolandensis TaxID=3095367 RepID=UPI003556B307